MFRSEVVTILLMSFVAVEAEKVAGDRTVQEVRSNFLAPDFGKKAHRPDDR
jgi:hypothetical protein